MPPEATPHHHPAAPGGPPPRAGEEQYLPDSAATETFGGSLAPLVRPGDVIALSGQLGAGKTSLARGLLAALGLAGEAPSPTFAIVQPYAPPEVRVPVLHVDLYRLEHADEIRELGLDEALTDSVLLVEWPERAGDRWPDALWLTLSPEGEGRRLTARVPAAWEGRWPT
ncbi:MAG: tRNA threonylcarbamoyladenosine biosynthesis protein TsaE [Sphingomonas bacterium]|uniref:tRNA (adenosine(37)-N6)-threonylcarbamoyltransferase complex ATPase subunit type 1 TsaE n=1 Tax=Sphingomonas bacterium TaxID=1895847 RepID=UPI002604CB61|nr:tRNA (adenosine(37)-N6)-threonylcarbamoyltransferase complex ATPase subunit type 1 TsaE [Sphingomonas bacterium]MDB5695713.1 tRNA threonylcarbamoyladenosine biosynthesis protein TsaE [Sphingomonas bacterium]